MTDIRESDKIYHGCVNKNKYRTNTLIKKGEKCFFFQIFFTPKPFINIPYLSIFIKSPKTILLEYF